MTQEGRKFCYKCFKPAVVCVCSRIKKIKNKTRILILQHLKERSHHIGTARFATLGLENVEQKIAYPNDHGKLSACFKNLEGAGLLYPSPQAIDLSTLSASEKPSSLVVLDGTWNNAFSLYKENKWLHNLPHYSLAPSKPSNYRIRREPKDSCISTIEAIVESLKILEHTDKFDQLLTAFDSMIDDQLVYIKKKTGSIRTKRPRKKIRRSIPRAIAENFDNLVIVFGETFVTNSKTDDAEERILLSWNAIRMGDGATFEHVVANKQKSKKELFVSNMGISSQRIANALDVNNLEKKWNEYSKKGDIVCAWNKGTLKAFFAATSVTDKERPESFVVLKAAYGNIVKEKFGILEDVIAKEKLKLEPNIFLGRANIRMGNTIAIAKYLSKFKDKTFKKVNKKLVKGTQ